MSEQKTEGKRILNKLRPSIKTIKECGEQKSRG